MANNLCGQMHGAQPDDGGFSRMAAEVMRFADNYRGDPFAEAESLIRAGRITPEQWEQAKNMARQIVPFLGRR